MEGKYYVWSLAEVNEILGRSVPGRSPTSTMSPSRATGKGTTSSTCRADRAGGASCSGARISAWAELDACRARLLATRKPHSAGEGHQDPRLLERPDDRRPSEGGRILKDERYLQAAACASAFILDRMRRDDGRLLHAYKDGRATLDAYLDDYANLIDGLTRLYEATGEPRWIESALELARIMIDDFADVEHGGFFFTGRRHEALIARQKDLHDNATPSGNAMAATALVRLGALTGSRRPDQGGRSALGVGPGVARAPAGRRRSEPHRARLSPGLDP